jgi:hypothetical protein
MAVSFRVPCKAAAGKLTLDEMEAFIHGTR